MTIRLCRCGNPIDMSDENVAECNAICKAEFGVPMGHPDLVVVCEDCYAIVEDAEDTAEQSWTIYFDLENSGCYVFQDGELFREETGGTYTPVGRVRK